MRRVTVFFGMLIALALTGCAALDDASVRDNLETAVDVAQHLRAAGTLTDERWDLALPLLDEALEILKEDDMDTARAVALAIRIYGIVGGS